MEKIGRCFDETMADRFEHHRGDIIFLIAAVLLVLIVPRLLGFFWPFVASWLLAMLAAPLCNFLEKHIRLNKQWASALIIILVLLILAGCGYLLITKLGREMISFFPMRLPIIAMSAILLRS